MHTFVPTTLGLAPEPDAAIRLNGPDETRRLGAAIATVMRGGGFVALIGNLGAGKTTLTQGLVESLDEQLEASSPTYTLLNEYESSPRVYHFDLYRLQSVGELETVGYWDYAEDERAIVLVEWLDQVPEAWVGRGLVIELIHDGSSRRAKLWDGGTGTLGRIFDAGAFDPS